MLLKIGAIATLLLVGLFLIRSPYRVLYPVLDRAPSLDQLYLESFYANRPKPAFLYAEHFLVTSSLTKAFGLSGIRCVWVLCSPQLAHRMWRIPLN